MARKSKRGEEVVEERDIWEGLDPDIDLDVNEADLIGEMLNQSNLMFRYSRLVAVAEEEMNFASEIVKSTRSRLILEVNRNPELLEGVKLNVSTSEAYYREHPEYKGVKEVFLEKNRIYNELMSAVRALHNKKDMLQNLARYELSGLISSEPRLPADASPSEKEGLKEKVETRERQEPRKKMGSRK